MEEGGGGWGRGGWRRVGWRVGKRVEEGGVEGGKTY